MREQWSRLRQLVEVPGRSQNVARLVVGAGALMILLQVAFRAWALYPSWFYLDDYNLVGDALGEQPGGGYLLVPYNSHLMPGGRLLVWLVAASGDLNWGLAATLTLALQAAAGAAALWMLVSLFGTRWGVLGPLSLYLSSAMTVPAMMWWTASLNQVPLQVSIFLAVGTWVRYLRTRRLWWLAATTVAGCLGLCFYVKALLIFPLLAFLAVAYFSSGFLLNRLRNVIQQYWPALVVGALVAGGYLFYYTTHVSQPFTESSAALVAKMAESMLATAFTTGVWGGPWDWTATAPPNAFADPPAWTVHLAWVAVVLVVLYGALTRHRTLRAWVLLGGYLVGLLALLVTSRAPVYGQIIGLEYRYLTDAACVVALCLGLVFLPLRGALQPSRSRTEPLLLVRVPSTVVVVLIALTCASGTVSATRYVAFWHSENASDAYMHTLAQELREHGAVDLADVTAPEGVIPRIFAPDNRIARLVRLVSDSASFPRTSPSLAVVGDDGTLRRALIGPGVASKPGPVDDCGWTVTGYGRTIPLTGTAFPWEWWVRIGYLASQDSPVVVTAGSSRIETRVEAGLNSLYVQVDGTFDGVRISGLRSGTAVCVDTIEVGQPEAGERLS